MTDRHLGAASAIGPRGILGLLCAFALLSYVQRTSVSVASAEMLPALHFSQIQLGWLNAAFTAAYAVSQFPGGVLGQRFGARAMLTICGLLSIIATLATPAATILLGGTAVFVVLIMAQSTLGISQGPLFPISAAAIEVWFERRSWALATGLQTAAMNIGGAVTPLVIVLLSGNLGWRGALFLVAAPVCVVTGLWALFARSSPEHRAGSDSAVSRHPREEVANVAGVLANRNVVLLSISYAAMNYGYYLVSFWAYLYLVQVRHFSGLESGVAGMAPWLGAAVGAAAGGAVADQLASRHGERWGYRLTPVMALPTAGALFLLTIWVPNPYLAVLTLTAVFLTLELTEGSYWAATMFVAEENTGAATGVLNTGGNVGGILSQPAVAYLSGTGHWDLAFFSGTAFAVIGAVLWLAIDGGACGGPTRNQA